MTLRCSSSKYLGVGRLSGYRWIINDRGYANVVSSANTEDAVYGLIYDLTSSDERSLDANEGVPYAYSKEMLLVDFWASKDGDSPVDVTKDGEKRDLLVYIDRNRTTDHKPKAEYIYRMNQGIEDGLKAGIPEDYVEQALRQFIPEKVSEEVKALAIKQASGFEDED